MPSFDELLNSIPEDIKQELTDRDVVGLAGYYLRKVEGEHPFATKQIRGVVEPSLQPVPNDSIGSYPSQLGEKEYFQRINGEWDLTEEGLNYYGKMVTLASADDAPRDDDDLFISVDYPDDDFYGTLVDDINRSYRHHIYDATMILTRKLLENLLIECLRLRLGTGEHLEAFYIPDQGRFQPFSVLIDNFGEHLGEFKPFDPDLDATFVSQLDQFRTRANANAHSIQVDLSPGEVEALSDDANSLSKRLFRLRTQARLDAERNN